MKNFPWPDFTEKACPACGKIVEITQKYLEFYDGHHMEFPCPHCGKFICWVCDHVY